MRWFKRKPKLKSTTIKVAHQCGYLDDDEAQKADETVAEEHWLDPGAPTLQILLTNGYLSDSEASEVSTIHSKEYPKEQLKAGNR